VCAPVFGQGGEALGVLAFFEQGACEGLGVAPVGVGVPGVVRVDGAADFGDERGVALRVQQGQVSQNGCDENATTSGEKSISLTRSRSSHDSYPTRSLIVDDHHSPEKLRCPM
jgi:hypothetical protein